MELTGQKIRQYNPNLLFLLGGGRNCADGEEIFYWDPYCNISHIFFLQVTLKNIQEVLPTENAILRCSVVLLMASWTKTLDASQRTPHYKPEDTPLQVGGHPSTSRRTPHSQPEDTILQAWRRITPTQRIPYSNPNDTLIGGYQPPSQRLPRPIMY